MFYHAPIIAIGTRIEFIPKGAQYGGSSETKVLYLQQVFFVNASQSYDFFVNNACFGGEYGVLRRCMPSYNLVWICY